MSCAAKGCKNCKRLNTSENISFHRFPTSDLSKQWLLALGRDEKNWAPTKNKFVCSEHFVDGDFYLFSGKKHLKANSVPTRNLEFDFPAVSSQRKQNTMGIKVHGIRKRKLIESREANITSSSSSGSSSKRRRFEAIKKIHSYSISPRKLKLKNQVLLKRQTACRKKLYKKNQQIKTLKTQVQDLKTVTDYLKTNLKVSSSALDHLEKTFDSVPHILMRRCLKNIEKQSTTHESYPPLLRQFAATLQFYSNKAYEEVRSQFQLALPHPATIRKWYKNLDCQPGFIDAAFEALKFKMEEAQSHGRELLCSVMLDEISIKKQIEFDGKQMWGYVDVGIPVDNDEMQPASEALVLMVVSHQSHWKLPFAYFFIKSLTGEEKANIVRESLIRLYKIGVSVTSVTCDGPVSNFSMMKYLGCNFDDIFNLQTWFKHPSNQELKVFAILDACHMLKLMRNNFANLTVFKDPNGNIIKWSFINQLYELQNTEGLHLANKLKKAHMEWYKQKMKVNLAAQTLSSSIADAIAFLDEKMGLAEFGESKHTVDFIRRIDHLFDVLNSRSPQARGFKSPLRACNEEIWRPFLLETVEYLLHCTDVSGRPLYSTPKKTPFIGFSITALSILGMFDTFVATGKLSYILTYKVSQDHLETFFCSVRSKNGWNNNPSCLQFMRTFKRLLLHTKISPRGGNCKILDTTTVLHLPSSSSKNTPEEMIDLSMYRRLNFEPVTQPEEHDYDELPQYSDLSLLSLNITAYISGYVVKSLQKTLRCPECLASCEAEDKDCQDNVYDFLKFKNRGGLHKPSFGVVRICRRAEQTLRSLLQLTNGKLPRGPYFIDTFVVAVAQYFYSDVYFLFPDLQEHFFSFSPIDINHCFVLIKIIVRTYLKIRLHYLAKKYTHTIQGTAVRRELTKLILFNHQ